MSNKNKYTMAFIIPIVLLFMLVNSATLIGGFEGWFGLELKAYLGFILAFSKIFLILGLLKLVMAWTNLHDHPLLLVGAVMSVLILFFNTYFGDFQKAYHQKQSIGGALVIDASKLHEVANLFTTPYIQISNSGLGEIKYFEENHGKAPPLENIVKYRYASILNTKKTTYIINEVYNENRLDMESIKTQISKMEIRVEVLPKKAYFSGLEGFQFKVTYPTFQEYYQHTKKSFINFIKITNTIALLFSLLFIIIKTRQA